MTKKIGRPNTFDGPDNGPDLRRDPVFQTAKGMIGRFVENMEEVSVGTITRRFPEYQSILMDVLADLKAEGTVSYDEHRPAPTLVRAGQEKRFKQFVKGEYGRSWGNYQ